MITKGEAKMTREELSKRLKNFNISCREAGICCYVPGKMEFVNIYFGEMCDDDIVSDKYDSFIMIATYEFDGSEFCEKDTRSFDYSEAERKYGNNISLAVYDALFYLYKSEIAVLNILPVCLGFPMKIYNRI